MEETGPYVRITAGLSLGAPAHCPMLRLKAEWNVYLSGALSLHIEAEPARECPPLPRFGLRIFLPSGFSAADYLGLGPVESYPDKHEAAWWGRFRESADACFEHHIRPQESGAHAGCTRLEIPGENGRVLRISADRPFSFSLSRYSQEALADARHRHELQPEQHAVLCLDYAQSGIGTGSCGPRPAPEYLLSGKKLSVCFALQPMIRKE